MTQSCDLTEKHCVPCEGGVDAIGREAALEAALRAGTPPLIATVADGSVRLDVRPEGSVMVSTSP